MNDIILKYLRGCASGKEKEIFLDWLKASEKNKRLFSEVRDRWLESAPIIPVADPGYGQRAFARFAARINAGKEKQKGKRSFYPLRIAASVSLLLICSLSGYFIGQKQIFTPAQTREILMNRIVMGKDNKGSVTLPDGTTAWLNANSTLIYPEHFESNKRQVRLEGEGYFEVKRNEKSPFSVETDGMTVNVLGTHFNVSNYNTRKMIETTLLSGKVEVFLPGQDKGIILKPNQKISRDKESGSFHLTEVEAADYIIWIGDKMVCTNEKLSTILHRMEHWYNMEIECKPGVPLDHRLSLTIRKESPDEILKLLTLISPIRYTIEGDKIMISPQ